MEQTVQLRNLKSVAAHPDVLHLRGPEGLRFHGLETGRAVAHAVQPRHEPGEAVAPAGQQAPPGIPAVVYGPAWHIAAAYGHIGAVGQMLQQLGGVRRVMGKISVHLHHRFRA